MENSITWKVCNTGFIKKLPRKLEQLISPGKSRELVARFSIIRIPRRLNNFEILKTKTQFYLFAQKYIIKTDELL